jgi:hypothetical protein
MIKLGVAALACYAIHGTYHLYRGRPEDLLWGCHMGAALVGIGLLIRSMTLNGIGTLFLSMGTPLWFLYLAGGGEFMPTSCFTHLGGLAIGLYAIRHSGIPDGTWWKAVAAALFLMLITRLTTPAAANVNVAFAIQPGWEALFSSHMVYIMFMTAVMALHYYILSFVLRRWFVLEPAEEETP